MKYEYSQPHVATISPALKINLSNKIAINEKSYVTLITRPIKVGTYNKAQQLESLNIMQLISLSSQHRIHKQHIISLHVIVNKMEEEKYNS